MSEPSQAEIAGLLAELRDTDTLTCVNAATRLARLGDAGNQAIPILIELLQSPDPDVRGLMAASLGAFGPRAAAAVDALLLLLHDKEAHWFQDKPKCFPNRFRAAFAIADIDPTRAEIIPVLREAMKFKRLSYVPGAAHEALRTLGALAAPLLPDLRKLAASNDLIDRTRAQMTLMRIDPTYHPTEPMVARVLAMLPADKPDGRQQLPSE